MEVFSWGDCCYTNEHLPDLVGVTKRACNCADIRSLPQKNIPRGVEVDLIKFVVNCYGTFVLAEYEGKRYYLGHRDLELRRENEI